MTIFNGLDSIFTDCLGEAVAYTSSATGQQTTINGIYDDEFVPAGEGLLVGVESQGPAIHVSVNDTPDRRHGDTIERANGERYRVKGIQPDGRDMVQFILEDCT